MKRARALTVAIADLNKAIALDPKHSGYDLDRAISHAAIGDKDKAPARIARLRVQAQDPMPTLRGGLAPCVCLKVPNLATRTQPLSTASGSQTC